MATKKNIKNTKVSHLNARQKEYYDALMRIREQVVRQMEFHSSEALANNHNAGEKGMSTHMADLGSDNFLHDMELAMITKETDVLETIDESIERLVKDDRYGKCLDCGCEIGHERLMVKPYAKFCVKCKSIREKNGGMRPDFN